MVVHAGSPLFRSFLCCDAASAPDPIIPLQRDASCQLTAGLIRKLRSAEAVITTWDSPACRCLRHNFESSPISVER